jgi:hypothetical protein
MGFAVDAGRAARPGVPRERPSPERGLLRRPEQQRGMEVLSREGILQPTPVFGTAQPAKGLAGLVRRAAYGVPEQRTARWMLLVVADRIDVLGGRLARNLWLVPALVALAAGFAAVSWAAGRPPRR